MWPLRDAQKNVAKIFSEFSSLNPIILSESGCTELSYGMKFLRVLIFAIFAIFSTIRKKKIPAKKLFPAKICYVKIYSTTEIIKITI